MVQVAFGATAGAVVGLIAGMEGACAGAMMGALAISGASIALRDAERDAAQRAARIDAMPAQTLELLLQEEEDYEDDFEVEIDLTELDATGTTGPR
jgi:hypothetical protein